MTQLAGIIGSILLALCGLPQMSQSIKQGHSRGISKSFLFMWGLGELFLIIYIWNGNRDIILLANYLLNVIIILVISFYKTKD